MSGPPHESPASNKETSPGASRTNPQIDGLLPGEEFWRDHVPWLKGKVYQLRARYQFDRVLSWPGNGEEAQWRHEDDGHMHIRPNIRDVLRMSDGETVALKRISRDVHPYEDEISIFFSSESLKTDTENHCVPILEVLDVPDENNTSILVMPLSRDFTHPQFRTIVIV